MYSRWHGDDAHHLDALERVGIIERVVSSGDRRRRYVRLRRPALADLSPTARRRGPGPVRVHHNSARSQIAAALWRHHTGADATSAGTHPATQVHPGAVAAALRAGLGDTPPRALRPRELGGTVVVVTVCDRAHEELDPRRDWLHWSTPDPVETGTDGAFDAALAELADRITNLTTTPPTTD